MKHRYEARHRAQSTPRHARPSRQVWAAVAAVMLLAAPTPAHAQAPREAQAPSVVVAVRGNTLSGLAARWCGNASQYRGLAAGNSIANPNLIYVGQRIRITCTAVRADNTAASRSTTTRTTPAPTGWVHPLPGARITDCFGTRGGRHLGTDLAAPTGTPIHAVHAGTVAVVKYESGGGGYYIVLSHGGGTYSSYMHMVRRSPLNVGQAVAAGQVVGNVGESGDATGPHLHFEVHQGLWHKVNPAAFMRSHGVAVGC